jgi:hypothetical protein
MFKGRRLKVSQKPGYAYIWKWFSVAPDHSGKRQKAKETANRRAKDAKGAKGAIKVLYR